MLTLSNRGVVGLTGEGLSHGHKGRGGVQCITSSSGDTPLSTRCKLVSGGSGYRILVAQWSNDLTPNKR